MPRSFPALLAVVCLAGLLAGCGTEAPVATPATQGAMEPGKMEPTPAEPGKMEPGKMNP